MHTRNVLIFLGLAWIASAVPTPLNINLGAYSPALVVGDGAIAFGGGGEGGAEAVLAEGAGEAGGEGEGAGAGGGEETATPETEEATASTFSTAAVSYPIHLAPVRLDKKHGS